MKKKIFIIALAACLFALSIAGSSIAYFTDVDEVTNVFTVGDVDIQLTEAAVKVDDNKWHIIKDDTKNRLVSTGIDYEEIRTLWPGQSVYKDPTIENIGSEDAYVGAIITITNDNSAGGNANIAASLTEDAVDEFIVGLPFNSAAVNVDPIDDNGTVVGYTIYVVFAGKLVANTGTSTVFTGLAIPATWGNNDMANLKNLNITVKAYATQTAGFETSVEAITTAFPNTFELN